MSGHSVKPRDPDHRIAVGWDQTNGTFFANVWSREREARAQASPDTKLNSLIARIGRTPNEVIELEHLKRRLQPYAYLNQETMAQLRRDRDAAQAAADGRVVA